MDEHELFSMHVDLQDSVRITLRGGRTLDNRDW